MYIINLTLGTKWEISLLHSNSGKFRLEPVSTDVTITPDLSSAVELNLPVLLLLPGCWEEVEEGEGGLAHKQKWGSNNLL